MQEEVYKERSYLLVAALCLLILPLFYLPLHELGELFLQNRREDVAEPRLADFGQIFFRRQVPLNLLVLGDPGKEIDQSQALYVRAVGYSDSFAVHVVFLTCKNVPKESSAQTQ